MDALPGKPTSPSRRLVAGGLLTLLILLAYGTYTLNSVRRMRQVQADIVDQNRKAALQLIRIESDLNALALAMRDMLDNFDGYPLAAWSAQLDRIRENLDDAISVESRLATGRRDPQQTAYLQASFRQFWLSIDRMKATAAEGPPAAAQGIIRQTLQPQLEALSSLTARLLVQNNAEEQRAAERIAAIFAEIERNAYVFLAISLVLVVGVSAALIRSNRNLFDRLATLSNQRRELAQQLISTQESTLRSVSRDLHDEFGQILIALGAMLTRAQKRAPQEFVDQVQESKVLVQETLERVRALSQRLQPVILEEEGLGPTVEWHLLLFQRQTGIAVDYTAPDTAPTLPASRSIHIYRILQEALNNAARHARIAEITVRLSNDAAGLELCVEDHGIGLPANFVPSVGLTGMCERAELLGGTLSIGALTGPGTTIKLTVPHV